MALMGIKLDASHLIPRAVFSCNWHEFLSEIGIC